MRAALLVTLLLPAVAAAAPPTIAGDAAVALVTVPGVEAAGAPRAAGDRIELPIAAGVPTSKTYYGGDPTIRKIEILATPAPRVSVQLRRKDAVAPLAAATQLVEEDGAVVLRIPRDRKLIAAAPVAAPPPAPKVEPEEPAITVEPAAVQVKTVSPTPAPPPPAPTPPPALTGIPATASAAPLTGVPAGEGSATPGRLLLLGAILCACGAAALVARRRRDAGRKGVAPHANIEVLASRPLGGKTRAVLLSVNDSQMLLAVSDHGARLLGQWFGGDDGVPVADRDIVADRPLFPVPDLAAEPSPDTEPQVPVGVRRPSAAVAGLLKLRREGDARFAGDVARALRAVRR